MTCGVDLLGKFSRGLQGISVRDSLGKVRDLQAIVRGLQVKVRDFLVIPQQHGSVGEGGGDSLERRSPARTRVMP